MRPLLDRILTARSTPASSSATSCRSMRPRGPTRCPGQGGRPHQGRPETV